MSYTIGRKAGILATLALGAGLYGLVPGSFGTAKEQTAPPKPYTEKISSTVNEKLDLSEALHANDGLWRVAKRSIYQSQDLAQKLAEKHKAEGASIKNMRVTIDGIAIDRINNDTINRLARKLPADERNRAAIYCPSQHSSDKGCAEEYLRLGSKQRPNHIYTDVAISFDVEKTMTKHAPAQYKDIKKTAPAWYTASAFSLAALGGAGALYGTALLERFGRKRQQSTSIISNAQPAEERLVPASVERQEPAIVPEATPEPQAAATYAGNGTPAIIEPTAPPAPQEAAVELVVPADATPPPPEEQKSPWRVNTAIMKQKKG